MNVSIWVLSNIITETLASAIVDAMIENGLLKTILISFINLTI